MAQLLVLLGVVTVGILPVHPASPGRYGLQLKSRWMRGCWEGTQGKRHLAENWGRTGVKMLPATSQTAVDGKTLPCTAHAGGTFQTSADWWDRRPKAICVTGGSQQQRRCGQCGKCFPEGDPPNPDDDLWKELDGVFGCPAAPFGAPNDEVLWFKGQAALRHARETALPREYGHPAGPNI